MPKNVTMASISGKDREKTKAIQDNPEKILALIDWIFLGQDNQTTIPS